MVALKLAILFILAILIFIGGYKSGRYNVFKGVFHD